MTVSNSNRHASPSFQRLAFFGIFGSVFAILAVGVASLFFLHDISQTNRRDTKKYASELIAAESLQNLTEEMVATGRGYLITGDNSLLAQLQNEREAFWTDIGLIKNTTLSDAARKAIDEAQTAGQAYQASFDRIAYLRIDGGSSTLVKKFDEEIRPRRENFAKALGKFEAVFLQHLDDEATRSDQESRFIFKNALFGFLAAISAIALLGIKVSRGLTQIYEKEKRARQTREDILAIVSHDLRAPLTTFQLGCDLIERQLNPVPATTSPVIKRMRFAIQRMAQLIEEVLDLSKIESGTFSVLPERVVIDDLLTQLKNIFEPIAAEKMICLKFHSSISTAYLDRAKVMQAVSNLISNAIKFTDCKKEIGVFVFQEEGKPVIEVRDEGRGIAPSQIPHVFERYRQTRSSDRVEGVGLGLYIVRGIVEAHHGNVEVESELGIGTSFKLHFPPDQLPDKLQDKLQAQSPNQSPS